MTASREIHIAACKYRLNGLENVWVKNSNKVTFCVASVLENGKIINAWLIIYQKISIFPIISGSQKKSLKKIFGRIIAK